MSTKKWWVQKSGNELLKPAAVAFCLKNVCWQKKINVFLVNRRDRCRFVLGSTSLLTRHLWVVSANRLHYTQKNSYIALRELPDMFQKVPTLIFHGELGRDNFKNQDIGNDFLPYLCHKQIFIAHHWNMSKKHHIMSTNFVERVRDFEKSFSFC